MKTKNFNKKLFLKKETIVTFERKNLAKVFGGNQLPPDYTIDCPPTVPPMPTFELPCSVIGHICPITGDFSACC
ncbi:MAG: class I lanthipeptide [Candidatus Aminicenantes bacterium]|nr:class I lanthipeptide [Candidatus Aminicenantes bacterium]